MSATTSGRHRVVVVTGASSGIGLETVALLRRRGDDVVLASRSAEALAAAVARTAPSSTPAGSEPGRVLVVPTDVGDRDAVEALFATARAELGRVDAVVHAAAVLAYGRFDEVPADVYDRALQTTLIGTANVARCALEGFRPGGRGSLVVVGSLLGKIATPLMSSYVTAKWGVHGLVRCLQLEARSTPGIEVSLVSPGGVDTPIYHLAGTYVGLHGKPPPPVVSAEKVARTVVRCLDRPRRDVDADLGPANAVTVLGFRALPAVFDLLVGPLLRWTGFGATAAEPTPGNVTGPRPLLEAPTGGFGSVPLDLPEPVRRAVPTGGPGLATAVVVGAGVASAAVRWATRRAATGGDRRAPPARRRPWPAPCRPPHRGRPPGRRAARRPPHRQRAARGGLGGARRRVALHRVGRRGVADARRRRPLARRRGAAAPLVRGVARRARRRDAGRDDRAAPPARARRPRTPRG